jgi:hypothetical protein
VALLASYPDLNLPLGRAPQLSLRRGLFPLPQLSFGRVKNPENPEKNPGKFFGKITFRILTFGKSLWRPIFDPI